MEQPIELGGNNRSFGDRVKVGFRTTSCMVGMLALILMLSIKKLFS